MNITVQLRHKLPLLPFQQLCTVNFKTTVKLKVFKCNNLTTILSY